MDDLTEGLGGFLTMTVYCCADCGVYKPSYQGVRGKDGLMRCKNGCMRNKPLTEPDDN